MATSLDSIIGETRRRLTEKRATADMRALERAAELHVPRGFRRRLSAVSQHGIAVIAELKKASPSKGLIRADFRPGELAADLEKAGAAALSVLTDEPFFDGSLDNLRQASASTSLPCLRKDFIVDEFQLVEARADRADAVLLIVAALSDRELASLAGAARSQALDVLCEAHDEDEVQRAVDAGCEMIGINSRNLRTFDVSLETAFRLVEKIPAGVLSVAESGIKNGADVARLRSAGFYAFLIGESLMKAADPGVELEKLINDAKTTAGG